MGGNCSHVVDVWANLATKEEVRDAVRSIEAWQKAQDQIRTGVGCHRSASTGPLLARVGGSDAVKQIVESFYRKLYLNERLLVFLHDAHVSYLRAKQSAFMMWLFGPPNVPYGGKNLRVAHLKLIKQRGFSPEDFELGMEFFEAAMRELEVPEAIIGEVMGKIRPFKTIIFTATDNDAKEEERWVLEERIKEQQQQEHQKREQNTSELQQLQTARSQIQRPNPGTSVLPPAQTPNMPSGGISRCSSGSSRAPQCPFTSGRLSRPASSTTATDVANVVLMPALPATSPMGAPTTPDKNIVWPSLPQSRPATSSTFTVTTAGLEGTATAVAVVGSNAAGHVTSAASSVFRTLVAPSETSPATATAPQPQPQAPSSEIASRPASAATPLTTASRSTSAIASIPHASKFESMPASAGGKPQSGSRPALAAPDPQSGARPTSAAPDPQSGSRPRSAALEQQCGSRPPSVVLGRPSGSRPASAAPNPQFRSKPASAAPDPQSRARPTSAAPDSQSGSRPGSAALEQQCGSRPPSAAPDRPSGSRPASAALDPQFGFRPASAALDPQSGSRPPSAAPDPLSGSRPTLAGPNPQSRPKPTSAASWQLQPMNSGSRAASAEAPHSQLSQSQRRLTSALSSRLRSGSRPLPATTSQVQPRSRPVSTATAQPRMRESRSRPPSGEAPALPTKSIHRGNSSTLASVAAKLGSATQGIDRSAEAEVASDDEEERSADWQIAAACEPFASAALAAVAGDLGPLEAVSWGRSEADETEDEMPKDGGTLQSELPSLDTLAEEVAQGNPLLAAGGAAGGNAGRGEGGGAEGEEVAGGIELVQAFLAEVVGKEAKAKAEDSITA